MQVTSSLINKCNLSVSLLWHNSIQSLPFEWTANERMSVGWVPASLTSTESIVSNALILFLFLFYACACAFVLKDCLIYLCHISISHSVWLLRCIDYSNVMIVINLIEMLSLCRIFCNWCMLNKQHTLQFLWQLIEIPRTGCAISMVVASISIFTFNYCKNSSLSHLSDRMTTLCACFANANYI